TRFSRDWSSDVCSSDLANAAQTNTVTGTGATYTLANGTPDAGSGGGYSWTAFENITDATGTVDFAVSGSVTGDVTADVLDYSGYGSAVTFDLANGAGASTGIGGTWSGVTAVTGSGNSDTLTAGAVTLTLANGTPDAGSDGTVSWTSFETINAATATVDFAVSGSVTGDVTADVLDYDSYTQDLTLDITAGTITNGGVGGTVIAITVNANAAQTNTVTGTGATYTLANGTPDAG